MVNVIFNDFSYEILPKQQETWDKYCKIIQWGRANPTRFLEEFVGLQMTDHQKYVMLSSWLPANVVWVCSRSTGKALVLDTPIYCISKNGEIEKKILKDIKLGDILIDKDGQQTKVIQLHPIIYDDVYEIEFDDGEIIQCNKDHLWTVYDNRNDKIKAADRELKNITTLELFNYYQTNNKRKYSIPIVKPIELSKKYYDVNPYLLGLYIGDGICGTSNIAVDFWEVDDQINQLKKRDGDWIYTPVSKKGRERDGKILIEHPDDKNNRHEFSKQLKKIGVYKQKIIPSLYKNGSIEQRKEFLRGIFDSDGSVNKKGNCFFRQKNKQILLDVSEILFSLGIKNNVYYYQQYDKRTNKIYNNNSVFFYGDKEEKLFGLERKVERLQDKNKPTKLSRKTIVRVSKTSCKNFMRCITVDSKSGTFLCGKNFTVTHNSFMSAPLIMARSLLIPSHNTYIMGPTGSQAQETFSKMENLAKNNIASVVGVSSVFLDETVRVNSKADPFVHDKNSYHVELYNGSTVNTLNSVAKNIVGIR